MRLVSTLKIVAVALATGAVMAFGAGPALTQGADPVVMLETTKGQIMLQVYRSAVPNTSNNFLDLVQRGFYNGLSFHRVESWCIQGGDPNGNGSGHFVDDTGNIRYIRREINPRLRHNHAGVLAMARSQHPDSASCQFYILKRPMPQLDGQYAVFGNVVRGMETVYRIGPGDRINSASIVQQGGNNAPSPGADTYETPKGSSGF